MIHSIVRTLRRTPRWFITGIFFALIAVFLVFYLRSINWDRLRELHINWALIVAGSAAGLLFRYFGAYIWRVILRALGARELPSYRISTDVYAQAWMGRYIPGTVTWIAGKVYLASQWGISKSRLAVASLLEGGSQVLAITFVSFLLLGFDSRLRVLSPEAKGALIFLGLLVLVILLPRVFNACMRWAYKTIKRRDVPAELTINGPAVSRSFGLYCIGALLSGLSCFLVVWAIDPHLNMGDVWFVTGAFGLATVAGMAAPFAPSGLGIRDGLQLVLLTAIMPKETALAATILVRLWSVAVDVIFFALARLFRGKTTPPTKKTTPIEKTKHLSPKHVLRGVADESAHSGGTGLCRFWKRCFAFLRSRRAFYVVLGWFSFESLWVAISSRYPMAFDEQQHFGAIQLHTHTWLPLFTHTPPNSYQFGAIIRDPSFLYYYVMSFPYRIVQLFTDNLTAQVITLRILNIGLVLVGLVLFRKLIMRLGLSSLRANVILAFFTLIPIFPLMAGQVSYDNLIFLLSGGVLLMAVIFIQDWQKNQIINAGLLTWLLILSLYASMVKYTFLPVLAAVVLCLAFVVVRHWRITIKAYIQWWKYSSAWVKAAAITLTIIGLTLFTASYGVNIIKYHAPVPRCDKVLTVEQCAAYAPWNRDYVSSLTRRELTHHDIIPYVHQWYSQMMQETFFEITSYFQGNTVMYYVVWPNSLLTITAWTLFIVGGIGLLYNIRELWRNQAYRLIFAVFFLYAASLFVTNVKGFIRSGVPVAIHGRYLIPLMLPVTAIAALSVSRLVRDSSKRLNVTIPRGLTAVLAIITFLILFQGGLLSFIHASSDSWFWPSSHLVQHVNYTSRRLLDIVTYQ